MIHLAHLQINGLMEDKYVRKNDRKEIDNCSKKGWWYRAEVRVSFFRRDARPSLLPDGKFAFAELKAPGESPRPLQKARHRLLRSLGFRVYVIDSVEQIGGMIDELRTS